MFAYFSFSAVRKLIQAALFYRRCQHTGEQLIAGVVATGNFQKIRNGPNGILRGPGDTDFIKKHDVENLVSDSL